MDAQTRKTIKRRAAESTGRVGRVVGASVTAVIEVGGWAYLRSFAESPDLLPLWVLIVVGVTLAIAGAWLGGKAETLIRRWFVIPGRVIDELNERLTEYEAAPKFVLDPIDPITAGPASPTEDGDPVGVMCIVRLRVTNEGKPGAALDWMAWAEFSDGTEEQVRKLTGQDQNLHLAAQGQIPRSDLIWERTAGVVDHGKTVTGYFLGLLPLGVESKMGDEWTLNIACRDYRHRPVGIRVTFNPEREVEGITSVGAPTLSTIVIDSNRKKPPSGESPASSEARLED